MFVGRAYEIALMNRLHQEATFQMMVLYGRRRVGKTTLITHFIQGKEALFFSAAQVGDQGNLKRFSREVLTHFDMDGIVSDFTDWETAFRFIGRQATKKQFILVIDEFPYLAGANAGILSILQNIIDHEWLGTKLYLILCGSTMSFMENEVLGYKSPLFGRRTGQLKIEPFDYKDAAEFMGNYSPEDKIIAYSIFGGTPHYINRLNSNVSIKENILKCVLEKGAYLYDEPLSILKQETREPALYNALIEVIAGGATRLNEIATKVGEDSNKCAKYIHTLIGLGFLEKETPYGEKANSRKTLYCIRDPFFIFWYRFVFPNLSLIEAEMGEQVFEKSILPELESYTGKLFERVCKEFLWRQNKEGKLPFIFEEAERAWGTDPTNKSQYEIDIVAGDQKSMLFCECKWRNESTKLSVLNALKLKSNNYNPQHRYYALFSKSDFGDLGDNSVLKFMPKDMYI